MNYRIIDGHCDTLNVMMNDAIDMEKTYNHISLESLKEGNVGIQFFAAWIDPRRNCHSPLQYGQKLIETYNNLLDSHRKQLMPVLNHKSAIHALTSEKIGCLLAVEGGDILEGNIDNLHQLYSLGVRLITLTWNHTNEIASGIGATYEDDLGLTRFGREVVFEMNKLGIIVDISHISYKSFWDVCEISSAPIVASHSNAKSICNNKRNLDDKQIKAIAASGGIIGINFYPPFLTEEKEASIDDILKHIDFIAGLVGIDYIGFGSDFDGIERTPKDVHNPRSFEQIIEGLLRLNYKEDHIKRICNENMMRVLKLTL